MRRSFLKTGAAPLTMAAAPAEDPKRRRRELYNLLGDLPPRKRPITAKTLATEDRGTFLLERLELDLNGLEPVPAYFVKPKKATGRVPGIVYNHYHGGKYKVGKDELLSGNPGIASPPYAEVLTGLGYCALAIDAWVFGGRSTRTEADCFKEMLWKGQVLWGMMMYDTLRALDYLLTRPEVDAARVGTLGMSMGSTAAWWLAALDERVKVCVDICCLTDYQALIEDKGLSRHGVYYFVPSLLKHFTTAQINALIAPRAHLGLAGNKDALTPVAGLDRIDRELRAVYAKLGRPENWRLVRSEEAHVETPEFRREIIAFLQSRL